VFDLPSKNLFSAYKGNGAFKNNSRIYVSKNPNLTKSLLTTGFPYDHGEKWAANMELFKYFTDKTQGVRRLGAASIDLCHVACGTIDGFWEFDLKPWDTAAGIMIVSEAGGKVTRMDGGLFNIYDDQILASNGIIHQDLTSNIFSITNTFNL
jgi:myo-inositol-1(or 4)-monophosphatase